MEKNGYDDVMKILEQTEGVSVLYPDLQGGIRCSVSDYLDSSHINDEKAKKDILQQINFNLPEGCKAIMPMSLTKEAYELLSPESRAVYDQNMKKALIINTETMKHDKDTLYSIASFYFQNRELLNRDIEKDWELPETKPMHEGSYDKYVGEGFVQDDRNFPEDALEDSKRLFMELGFNVLQGKKDSYLVRYEEVSKSKFAQIYDGAKGMIKGMFDKIKNSMKVKRLEDRSGSDDRRE